MKPAFESLVLPDGRRIAFRHTVGRGPTLVFLPGYMSDMSGMKAGALFEWAKSQGRGCLLLDYSGCGESDGAFADGTLSRWRDEVVALVEAKVSEPVVLVGSSMGGWLMLLVAEALGSRVASMIGIAAAPDFTRWGLSAEDRDVLARGEAVFRSNPDYPEYPPSPTYPGFFADGERQLQLGREIPIDCPVRLLHGQRDGTVPFTIALELAAALRSDDIQVTLVKDGDHNLSRPQDIALILRAAAELAGD